MCGDIVIHPELALLITPHFGYRATATATAASTVADAAAAAARAATAGTTAVTALACALLSTYSTSLHSHYSSRYYCPCATATDCHSLLADRGGQQQPLPHPNTLSPQQLREWVLQQARPGGRGFGFLRTAQRQQQSDIETFSPQQLSELVSQRCVTGSIEAAALGASESAAALGATESAAAPRASESAAALGARVSPATGPASAEALHTFTLDSGVSRCFFRDCTTLTPLAAPVPISLADPTGGPVVARASTVLPCPAVPSGSLSGLHLPTFSTNLVSNDAIQDVWVGTFIPGGQRVAISSCSCRVLSHQTLLWHHRLGHPSMPRLHSMHSCLLVFGLPRSLPSLPHSPALPCLPCVEERLCAAPHSSEFPPTTTPLQTLHMDVWGPAPVGGTDQERYFLLVVDDYTHYTTVFPLRPKGDVSGVLIPWIRATRCQPRERFCQDFPVLRLHSDKGGEFSSDRLVGLCGSRFRPLLNKMGLMSTSPTLRWTGKVGDALVFLVWGALSLVHDAKASKLSSRTLHGVFLGFPTDAPPWQFYHPRERRVFSSHDVTFDKSVCFYKRYPHASHPGLAPLGVSQVDPPPLVEPLEIASDSSGLAEGGDSAADDTAATHRSPHLETPPSFPPRPSSPPPQPAAVDSGAKPGGAEIEGEGSGGAATGGAGSGGAATGGANSWGADSWGAASPSGGGAMGDPAGGSPGGGGYGPTGAGAASPGGTVGTRGAAGVGGAGATSPGGTTGAGGAGPTCPRGTAGAAGAGAAGTGGAGAAGAASARGAAGAGGAGAGGTGGAGAAGPGGARTGGVGAARAGGAAGAGGAGGTGAAGTGGAGATGAGGAGAAGPGGARTRGTGATGAGGAARSGGTGAGVTGGAGAAGHGGARTRGAGAAGASGAVGAGGATVAGGATGATGTRGAGGNACARGAGAAGARGAAGAGGATGAAGAGGAGAAGTAPRQLFFYPQPQSSQPPSDSVLRQTRASTPVRARHVARPRPPAVPSTHGMALRPSSFIQRVVLPESPTSSLPHVPDPDSNLAHAASPTVTRLLATVVTDPNFEAAAVFSLVTELIDFASRSRLDYVPSLVNESESVYPPSIRGEPALSSDVLEDRQFELECLAAVLPRFASMLLCPEGDPDALDIPTPRSYAEAIVVDGMWIFRVKRPPRSPPAFKARYVARGFSQRQGVDYFHTFSPTPKMTNLRLLHVAAQRDYEMHSLDFSTAFSQGILHEEIWLRRPPSFTGSFPAGTQWSLRWPVYSLHHAPREWHDTLRTTVAALRFAPSSADLSLFLRTDTSLPPFYVLVYVNDLVFATADTEALALVKAELQERHTCTDMGELRSYLGLQITRDKARRTITLTQSHMVHQVLRHFGFQYSSPQPTPLSTGYSDSAPPSDESVERSGPHP
ncbi:unnamed protein product [Closterium sp. NIES-54]